MQIKIKLMLLKQLINKISNRGQTTSIFFLKISIFLFILFFYSNNLFSDEKIGLALSGGGARGFAHIGVLQVIDEAGLKIDYISGTSMGSIVGGLYAAGYSGKEIENLMTTLDWKSLLTDEIPRNELYISSKRWKPHTNTNFPLNDKFVPHLPQGIIGGNNIINKMFDFCYPDSSLYDFDDLPIPFRAVATNIVTGQKKVFKSGTLHQVMRASMSIPSIFEPFRIDNQLYIDGGISDNLPADVLKDMGATYIIGVKCNTPMRTKNNLDSALSILDQTISIGMTRELKHSLKYCDLIIEPNLKNYSSSDFLKIKRLIELGRESALSILPQLKKMAKSHPKKRKIFSMNTKLKFSSIYVVGNKYLSTAKVREYVGLKTGVSYSKQDIENSFSDAFSFSLFKYIYPEIKKNGNDNILFIHLKELENKTLGLDASYDYNNLLLSISLKLTNYIQKNSRAIFNINLGAKHALNIDYIKNYGKRWGSYFHIFPYIEESTFYTYNDEHHKTSSFKAVQYGTTLGTGVFLKKLNVLEAYLFYRKTKFYNGISLEDEDFESVKNSGLGLKYYYETIDDYSFPMKGRKIFFRYYKSFKNNSLGIYNYQQLFLNSLTVFPVNDRVSFLTKFNLGYSDKNNETAYNQFYVGGFDNFPGALPQEYQLPRYILGMASVRIAVNELKTFFVDLESDLVQLPEVSSPYELGKTMHCYTLKLGLNLPFAPLKAAISINEQKNYIFYLNLGHCYDPFEFSRK